MNVTLRQLRVFTGVYRTRSITRAARELGITQSAASLLIQQLETQLGVKLFDRSTRSVQPTLAADEAFAAAERMLSDAQGLSRRMRDLAQARAGRVVFLASAGTASALLPMVLAKFRTGHPDIEIDMRDVAADDLVPRLSTTDAEFAIGSVEGEFADMTIETLTSGRLSAIGRRTADFAARRSLTWDELVQLPTIAMRSETRIRMQIDQALSAQGKRLDPTYEVTLINTALAMTARPRPRHPSRDDAAGRPVPDTDRKTA
ncbi:LysR family transcriptional regulator, partial [Bradyrhizobium sp. NBAIM32]|uniref:LysR family transcriptional regulator n=1 Tax=Bradyrhizobium sp. NBAIM32 TaxID=2793809 RepID=UPI001CD41E3F